MLPICLWDVQNDPIQNLVGQYGLVIGAFINEKSNFALLQNEMQVLSNSSHGCLTKRDSIFCVCPQKGM